MARPTFIPIEQFISDAKLKHGDKFNYSKVPNRALKRSERVVIICPIHGDFEQTAAIHLKCGCRKCYEEFGKRLTQEAFIKKVSKKHNYKYDYSETVYTDIRENIKFICPEHGTMTQLASNHAAGHGCKECQKTGPLQNRSFDMVKKYSNSPEGLEEGNIYSLRLRGNNEDFFKIGITKNDVEKRISEMKQFYDVEILNVKQMKNLECAQLEKRLRKQNKHLKYKPSIKFGGWTECFKEEIIL